MKPGEKLCKQWIQADMELTTTLPVKLCFISAPSVQLDEPHWSRANLNTKISQGSVCYSITKG